MNGIANPKRTKGDGPVTIACINKAKTGLGVPLDQLTAALQKCYDEHFLPVWGYPVKLYNTKRARPTDWRLVYLDDADEAYALGYHDLTKNGQPVSKVFVRTTLDAGESISATASHELFEMVIDPVANLWAEGKDGILYGYEMSDPVEEDTFLVDGLPMSSFVYPSWFEPFKHPPNTKFDHLGRLNAPFTMSPGGYMIIKKRGRVREVYGSRAKRKRFAQECRLDHRSEYRKPDGLLGRNGAARSPERTPIPALAAISRGYGVDDQETATCDASSASFPVRTPASPSPVTTKRDEHGRRSMSPAGTSRRPVGGHDG